MQTTRATFMVFALFTSALATAGSLPDTVVKYRASDLASPAGVSAVYGMLKAAAEHTCDQLYGDAPARQRAYRKCVRLSLDNALRQLSNPALVALHQTRADERVAVPAGSVRVAGEVRPTGTFSR